MEGYTLDPNMLVNALTKDNGDAVGGNGLLWIFLLILFQNMQIFNARSETQSLFKIGFLKNPFLIISFVTPPASIEDSPSLINKTSSSP